MLVEVDKELESIFPRYLRNRDEDMLKFQAALDRKDFEFLHQLGHKLTGNAAGYGLPGLAALAREMEHAAGARQLETCRQILERMKAYLAELELKFV